MKVSRFVAGLVVVLPGFAAATLINSNGDAALAGSSVVDFESQTLGTYTSLTVGDVTFSADNNHFRLDDTFQGYNQTGIYLDNGTYNGNGFNSLTIDFSSSVSAFGFNWGMAESWANWELAAYDNSNTLIESYVLPSTQGSSAGEFFGIAASDISYATLGWNGAYDWVAIDNLTFTSISVPEPSTLAMFGLGLLGLSYARRKKFS